LPFFFDRCFGDFCFQFNEKISNARNSNEKNELKTEKKIPKTSIIKKGKQIT